VPKPSKDPASNAPLFASHAAAEPKHIDALYGDWFLEYASYVILERAVPHINDGFKPVQRRIMHSLWEKDDGRYNKVANVVGHCMQYHPHGDASIGDALVQLGQKELLIDTQGNWGNILTGDNAAAPRYIEARLSKLGSGDPFQPQGDGVGGELRWPQQGAGAAAGEVPAAAGAGRGRHRGRAFVPYSAAQFHGAVRCLCGRVAQ